MKFARIVRLVAGVWGFGIVTPLYFLHDGIVQQRPSLVAEPR